MMRQANHDKSKSMSPVNAPVLDTPAPVPAPPRDCHRRDQDCVSHFGLERRYRQFLYMFSETHNKDFQVWFEYNREYFKV
jgi:hypothetical protein